MSTFAMLPSSLRKFAGPTSCYGLDWGTDYAKLVRATYGGQRWTVTDASIIDVEAFGPNDFTGQAFDKVAALLRDGRSKQRGWKRASIACSLPHAWYRVWNTELPPGSHDERLKMLCHDLPDDENSHQEWAVDYLPIGFDEAQAAGVTAVALPKKPVLEFERRLHDAGFSCRFIDSPILSAARCARLIDEPPPADLTTGILDWGHTQTTLILARNERCLYSRQLRRCAVATIVEELSEALEVTEHIARQLLREHGFAEFLTTSEPVSGEIHESARHTLDRLSSELIRTLKYVREQSPTSLPEQFVLVGAGALPGADRIVSAITGKPARLWTMKCAAPIQTDILPMFANAASLAVMAGQL